MRSPFDFSRLGYEKKKYKNNKKIKKKPKRLSVFKQPATSIYLFPYISI